MESFETRIWQQHRKRTRNCTLVNFASGFTSGMVVGEGPLLADFVEKLDGGRRRSGPQV